MKNTCTISAVLILVLLALSCRTEDSFPRAVEEIQGIIKQQTAAWNRGDFVGFMAPYWHSESLTFQSGDRLLFGWESLLNRYETNYAGRNRGTLAFSDIDIKVLSEDLAYVLGRWNITLEDTSKHGRFTLILRDMPEGWRIIHDHSS